MAGVAALDSNVRKLLGGIDRKFAWILLAASGADDATEFPFAKTEPADQIPTRTVAQWAQDGEGGLAIAEWAPRMRVTVEFQLSPRADELGVRLKKRVGKEFVGDLGRFVGGPALVQQFRP